MNGYARGGNDTLISGTGDDNMWGDAKTINGPDVTTGADTFVFKPDSGHDTVWDFRQSDHDKIDVSAYGFHNIGDLGISDNGANTTIDLGAGNSVVLIGIAHASLLSAHDFIFA
jgi:Ca2+-binding RTX toxin-like protein